MDALTNTNCETTIQDEGRIALDDLKIQCFRRSRQGSPQRHPLLGAGQCTDIC